MMAVLGWPVEFLLVFVPLDGVEILSCIMIMNHGNDDGQNGDVYDNDHRDNDQNDNDNYGPYYGNDHDQNDDDEYYKSNIILQC